MDFRLPGCDQRSHHICRTAVVTIGQRLANMDERNSTDELE